MKRIISSLQLILKYPVIALFIFYLYWLISVPVDVVMRGLILFFVYFIATVFEMFRVKNEIINLIIFSLFIPIAILGCFFAFWGILLLMQYGIIGFPPFLVFFLGCGVIIFSTYRKFSSNDNLDSKLYFAISLPVLCLNILFFAVFCPVVTDTARFGGSKYYVVDGVDDDSHNYQNFYKCKKWSFDCQNLYGSYSISLGPIIIDEQKGEINLLGLGRSTILYTDGKHPRTYNTRAASQFQDHIYQFSDRCSDFNNEEDNCGSYTYTLYECNLDFKSCDPLPMQYTTTTPYYDMSLIIEGNEESKEINIYDDYPEYGGVLIAKYGKSPRCYVEGCKILDQ